MRVRFGGRRGVRTGGPIASLLSVGLFACITAFTLGILAIVFGALRSSDVVQQAVVIAQRDDAAVQALGEPIELGWLISGSVSTSGSSGNASLTIPISGPEGKGSLYANAYKNNEGWHFRTLELQITPDGPLFDLLQK